MKLFDKFLKKLGTDRNTFLTYILTLVTIYLAVDRIVEMLLMFISGVSYSYWGPIQYTLALACPVFAYVFSPSSKLSNTKKKKVEFFNIFIIGLYIIAISMFTQWLNARMWLVLLSIPNYVEIITEFSYLVVPAMRAISLIWPVFTFWPIFNFLYNTVNDDKLCTDSLEDFDGINLSGSNPQTGPFTCELTLGLKDKDGKKFTIPEISRYQSLFVCGGSGSGKTSLIYEPAIAQDLEKKYFYHESAKELGFTALKTRIATLELPYDNDYLNKHFSLSMLKPVEGRENLYKAFVKKLTLYTIGDEFTYKDLGLSLMAPDYEVIEHMISVCKNLKLPYNIVDPTNPNSIGINPFTYDDPYKIAITISSVIQTLHINSDTTKTTSSAYREDIAIQAIENLSIILKEMYPRMNDGKLPNMEDMLKMFSNFELIEKMCEILAADEELSEKYSTTLNYFKKNFYHNSSRKETMEDYILPITSQLDNLLRIPGIKSILCNRESNINFDNILKNGEITFVCTRRGELGSLAHTSFGLFFLISFENATLRRPGNENSRIPHFLYIDEFADFICKETEGIFTMFRKYRVGTTISTQSLQQLSTPNLPYNSKSTILANCANKVFTGNGEADELSWWSDEFGTHREWQGGRSMDLEKGEYDPKMSGVKWGFTPYFKPGKLQTLGAKDCAAMIRGTNGKPDVSKVKLSFLSSKYKEPFKVQNFNFEKFSYNSVSDSEDSSTSKRFNPKKLDFTDERNEINPVQTNTTDSSYQFDDEDPIITNKRKKI